MIAIDEAYRKVKTQEQVKIYENEIRRGKNN